MTLLCYDVLLTYHYIDDGCLDSTRKSRYRWNIQILSMFNPQFGSHVARLIDVPVECNIIHTANMEPLENKWNLFDGSAKKKREKEIILNKQIPSSAPCKDFLPWPLTNLTSVAEKKQTHLIFFLLLWKKLWSWPLPWVSIFPFSNFLRVREFPSRTFNHYINFSSSHFFNWPPLYISWLVIE